MSFIEIAKKTGHGLAMTTAILAAVSLTAAPGTAFARDWHGGGHWGGSPRGMEHPQRMEQSRRSHGGAVARGLDGRFPAGGYAHSGGLEQRSIAWTQAIGLSGLESK